MGSKTNVELEVNGQPVSVDVEPRTLLVTLLREHLRLTGTHVGCDTTQCGCCTIHLDGEAVKACTMFAVQARGRTVTTIEGLAAKDGTLHPMQQAFQDHHGLQCGYCTPGMVMMACDIARRWPDLDEETVRHQLDGNICRCTGYRGIVAAVLDGAQKLRTGSRQDA